MSAEITHINGSVSIAESLRNIADEIDAGEHPAEFATLLIGCEMFSMGMGDDERAAESTVFELNVALYQIMKAATSL